MSITSTSDNALTTFKSLFSEYLLVDGEPRSRTIEKIRTFIEQGKSSCDAFRGKVDDTLEYINDIFINTGGESMGQYYSVYVEHKNNLQYAKQNSDSMRASLVQIRKDLESDLTKEYFFYPVALTSYVERIQGCIPFGKSAADSFEKTWKVINQYQLQQQKIIARRNEENMLIAKDQADQRIRAEKEKEERDMAIAERKEKIEDEHIAKKNLFEEEKKRQELEDAKMKAKRELENLDLDNDLKRAELKAKEANMEQKKQKKDLEIARSKRKERREEARADNDIEVEALKLRALKDKRKKDEIEISRGEAEVKRFLIENEEKQAELEIKRREAIIQEQEREADRQRRERDAEFQEREREAELKRKEKEAEYQRQQREAELERKASRFKWFKNGRR